MLSRMCKCTDSASFLRLCHVHVSSLYHEGSPSYGMDAQDVALRAMTSPTLMKILVLQGTLFHDRMKPEVVNQIKRDLVNLEEAYLIEHAGAEIQRV